MLFWLKTSCMCIKNNTLGGTGSCIKGISCSQATLWRDEFLGSLSMQGKLVDAEPEFLEDWTTFLQHHKLYLFILAAKWFQACWHIKDCELGHIWFKVPVTLTVMPNTPALNQIQPFYYQLAPTKDAYESISPIEREENTNLLKQWECYSWH